MAKKKELNPEVIEVEQSSLSDGEMRQLANKIESSVVVEPKAEDGNFYKTVVSNLLNSDNISSKTEYLNVRENFAGTKLEYYAEYGNIPYLKKFVKIFETKRVSLERKGRKEILMALQERRREEEESRMNQLKTLMGV